MSVQSIGDKGEGLLSKQMASIKVMVVGTCWLSENFSEDCRLPYRIRTMFEHVISKDERTIFSMVKRKKEKEKKREGHHKCLGEKPQFQMNGQRRLSVREIFE